MTPPIPWHLAIHVLRFAYEQLEETINDIQKYRNEKAQKRFEEQRKRASDAHQHLLEESARAAAVGDQRAKELHSTLLQPQHGSNPSLTPSLTLPCVCVECGKLFSAAANNRLPSCPACEATNDIRKAFARAAQRFTNH